MNAAPTPDTPEPLEAVEAESGQADPLALFRSWHGFLIAALVVNALFVWGMFGNVQDADQRLWYKTLVWLPFNAIASAVYYAIMQRLCSASRLCVYRLLCTGLIVANWLAMILA